MAKASKPSHRLGTLDASFLYHEKRNSPLHLGILQTLEGEMEFERLIGHFESRIRLLPRYRQRLVFAPFNLAHATLEDDPDFKLRDHFTQHKLPTRASNLELTEAAMHANESPLERSRPLWELHLFQGLEGGRSALLWKIHHCIVDGVSASQLLATAMDPRPDAPAPVAEREPWAPASLPDHSKSLLDAVTAMVQNRLDEVREAGRILISPAGLAERGAAMAGAAAQILHMMSRPIVAAPWNSGLVSRARALASLKVCCGDLRVIRNALGGSVNDVVLSILSEGAARYLKHHNVATAGLPLRIGCPVSVRRKSEAGAMGNRISVMFPELPAMPMDPVERYRSVVRETGQIKAARAPQELYSLGTAANFVSPSLQYLISRITGGMAQMLMGPPMGINFVATNVPGTQVPMFLAGQRTLEFIGLVPLAGTLGYGVTILSYNRSLFIGAVADPQLMPDVEFMKSCVAGAFEELKAAAQRVLTGHRSHMLIQRLPQWALTSPTHDTLNRRLYQNCDSGPHAARVD
jgi:diacylglycerol O-acyltransferase / wax synthase